MSCAVMSQSGSLYPEPLRRLLSRRLVLVVVIMLALFGGLAGYAAYQFYQPSSRQGPDCERITTTPLYEIDITCTFNVNLLIINNSTVNMPCNSSYVSLKMNASNIRMDLDVSGNWNSIFISYGEATIAISGNHNTISVYQTALLKVQDSGNANAIQSH